jgi:hypothetical protein
MKKMNLEEAIRKRRRRIMKKRRKDRMMRAMTITEIYLNII